MPAYQKNAHWKAKLRHACRGMITGMCEENSFIIHFVAAILVITAATILQTNRIEWCCLILCITVVITAEMFNSALERLAKALSDQKNHHLAQALDVGSAAVLVSAIGASAVGATILLHRLGTVLSY